MLVDSCTVYWQVVLYTCRVSCVQAGCTMLVATCPVYRQASVLEASSTVYRQTSVLETSCPVYRQAVVC